MKDSGIEWIGMIPADWNIVRIGNQYAERKTKVSDRDYPPLSVTMKGILPQLASAAKTDAHDDRKLVCKGDFAINSRSDRRGSCGISAYDGSVSLINTILQPRDEMNPEYYDWLFHSPMFSDEFYKWGHGIVDDLWTTNWQDMKRIAIPEPPLDEQQRIADYLGKRCAEIDALIEKTKATIEEHKHLRQAIITEAVTCGIRGKRSMKSSGVEWIGEIPSDWDLVKITRLLDYSIPYPIGDGDHGLISPSDYRNEGIPYLRVQNLGYGTPINHEGLVYITPETNERIRGSILRPNDVLFAKTGATIGKTGMIPETMPIANTTSHIGKITVSPDYNPKWVLFVLSSHIGYRQFWDIAAQKTTRPELSIAEIKAVRLSMPSSRLEQDEIVSYLDAKCAELDKILNAKELLLSELLSYKRSFIYEYVTGKKEVGVTEQSATTIIYPYFPAVLSTKKARFAQAVLMSRILDKCRTKMGRVKLEKMLYTIEASIGFDFDTEYVRQAAGPLDDSIYECEGIISRRNKWYTMKTSKYGVSYTPAKDNGKYKQYYDKYFTDYDSEIERIIGIFMDYDADQAEIVATLFAACNDFVIDRKEFTDEQLVDEVLNNWNDSKKRFSRDVWLRAIEQMRKNNIVPKGYGKRTVIKN